MFSFIFAVASLFWFGNALKDHHQEEKVSVHVQRGGALVNQTKRQSRQEKARPPADSVESIIKRMSGQSLKVFGPEKAKEALTKLSNAYQGQATNAYLQVDRDKLHEDVEVKGHMDDKAVIYGEIQPEGVLHMLAMGVQSNPNLQDSEGNPKPGNWVDLGSGFGKTVMLASLLGFEGDGIELGSPRFNMACDSLDRLKGFTKGAGMPNRSETECGSDQKGQVKFALKSFLDDSVDLSNADLLFTDSVYWTDEMMAILGKKATKMKKGSVIFSYKPFPSPAGEDKFKGLGQINMPVSWAPDGTFYHMQQVV